MSKILIKAVSKFMEKRDVKRLAEQNYDNSDILKEKDIPYINDGKRGHRLDIYYAKNHCATTPTIIDIHGGALIYAYKELNANFNYELVRLGYNVVGLSYELLPEVSFLHQVQDILTAFDFLQQNSDKYELNLNQCFVVGDSAGALLALMATAVNQNSSLQKEFQVEMHPIEIKALGLISIMIDTKRKDFLKVINAHIIAPNERNIEILPYLEEPVSIVKETSLPPCFLITSEEDVLLADTLKLEQELKKNGITYQLQNYPKGKNYPLEHVFSVTYPRYEESKEALQKMKYFMQKYGICSSKDFWHTKDFEKYGNPTGC